MFIVYVILCLLCLIFLFCLFLGRAAAPNYVAVAVGVLCCVALMFPTEGDRSSSPFHLSVNFKLVLAYVLGNMYYFFFFQSSIIVIGCIQLSFNSLPLSDCRFGHNGSSSSLLNICSHFKYFPLNKQHTNLLSDTARSLYYEELWFPFYRA